MTKQQRVINGQKYLQTKGKGPLELTPLCQIIKFINTKPSGIENSLQKNIELELCEQWQKYFGSIYINNEPLSNHLSIKDLSYEKIQLLIKNLLLAGVKENQGLTETLPHKLILQLKSGGIMFMLSDVIDKFYTSSIKSKQALYTLRFNLLPTETGLIISQTLQLTSLSSAEELSLEQTGINNILQHISTIDFIKKNEITFNSKDFMADCNPLIKKLFSLEQKVNKPVNLNDTTTSYVQADQSQIISCLNHLNLVEKSISDKINNNYEKLTILINNSKNLENIPSKLQKLKEFNSNFKNMLKPITYQQQQNMKDSCNDNFKEFKKNLRTHQQPAFGKINEYILNIKEIKNKLNEFNKNLDIKLLPVQQKTTIPILKGQVKQTISRLELRNEELNNKKINLDKTHPLEIEQKQLISQSEEIIASLQSNVANNRSEVDSKINNFLTTTSKIEIELNHYKSFFKNSKDIFNNQLIALKLAKIQCSNLAKQLHSVRTQTECQNIFKIVTELTGKLNTLSNLDKFSIPDIPKQTLNDLDFILQEAQTIEQSINGNNIELSNLAKNSIKQLSDILKKSQTAARTPLDKIKISNEYKTGIDSIFSNIKAMQTSSLEFCRMQTHKILREYSHSMTSMIQTNRLFGQNHSQEVEDLKKQVKKATSINDIKKLIKDEQKKIKNIRKKNKVASKGGYETKLEKCLENFTTTKEELNNLSLSL